MTRVVGTVGTLPCRGAQGGWNSRRPALPRYGSHRVRHVVGTGAVRWKSCCPGGVESGARAWTGSGESELASETLGGRASRNSRPRPWGVGRVGARVRGPEGSGESELAAEALRGRASRNSRPRP